MKNLFITSIILVIHLFPAIVYSQTITINESSKEKADYSHAFFKPIPNRYIAINYASPHGAFGYSRDTKHTEITCYDSSLNEVYTAKVKELSGNKYLEAIEIDKKLHILYADKKKVFRFELNVSDGQANGPSTEMLTVSNKPEKVFKGFSPDGNYCFSMFTDEDNEVFEGVVMDNQLNILTKFSFELGKLKGYIENTSCVLSSEGLLSIVNCVRVKSRRKDYRPLAYLITEISKEGQTVTSALTDLPTGRIDNMVWKPGKSGLSFTGLLSKAEKESYHTIVSGEFNSWQKKTTNLKESLLSDAAWWQKATGKYLQQYKTGGISTTDKIVKSFNGNDGSLILVLQSTQITYTQKGNYHYTDAVTRDVTLLKINPDHQLDWLQFVPIGQREPFYPIYSGVIATCPNKKDIILFFHDHQFNFKSGPDGFYSSVTLSNSWNKQNQLAVVQITENGTLTRNAAGENTDPDYHLAPRKPFFVTGNEVICTSYNIKIAGRSTYRPGIINIRIP
ncbi:MAG TPA: hypothetical protein VF008_03835 [Niastella sp.]